MLEAVSLTKIYQEGSPALDRLDLSVRAGEVFCLLGPNGAGKTTTVNLFLNFIEPTSGQALVCGIDSAMDPLAARRQLAYIPENVNLYGKLSGLENLEYFNALATGQRMGDAERRASRHHATRQARHDARHSRHGSPQFGASISRSVANGGCMSGPTLALATDEAAAVSKTVNPVLCIARKEWLDIRRDARWCALASATASLMLAALALGVLQTQRMAREHRAALIGLLSFWLLNSFLVPRLVTDVVRNTDPLPTALAFRAAIAEDKKRLFGHDEKHPGFIAFRDRVLQ